MVRQFGINQGDLLDWSIAKIGENELVMVVRKEGQKLEQNIVPYEVIQEEREKNKREIKSGKNELSVQQWLDKSEFYNSNSNQIIYNLKLSGGTLRKK
jgi:uncharacterized membrane-anchored protein